MKKIILLLAVAAFVASPLLVTDVQAGQGRAKTHAAQKHHKKMHHKKHHAHRQVSKHLRQHHKA